MHRLFPQVVIAVISIYIAVWLRTSNFQPGNNLPSSRPVKQKLIQNTGIREKWNVIGKLICGKRCLNFPTNPSLRNSRQLNNKHVLEDIPRCDFIVDRVVYVKRIRKTCPVISFHLRAVIQECRQQLTCLWIWRITRECWQYREECREKPRIYRVLRPIPKYHLWALSNSFH